MKNIKIAHFVSLILIAAALTSCYGIFCVDGNGKAVTEERIVTEFSGIANETSAIVNFETGDEISIFVEADENLMEYISTSVSAGMLEIEVKGATCIKPEKQVIIYITAPSINALYSSGSGDMFADVVSGSRVDIVSSGSGDIMIDYAETDDLDIRLSGSGDINIELIDSDDTYIKLTGSGDISSGGETNMLDLNSTGAGEILCGDLETGIADILITGSGNVHISVLNELFAVLTGSGNLYYYGDPIVSQTNTGSGNLIHRNK
ncbi:MAG: DUF2807 domain-containing protein [Bacteroidales bacterium]|nr:DUF2807 domain-containing protein [Bacteroidales bacterium]